MNLNNLKATVPAKLYNRGLDYFEQGFVEQLMEDAPNRWHALVTGTRDYEVSVKLAKDGTIVVSYSLCPFESDSLCKHVDAVQFCLTKGLGCPLGSILAGSKEFIQNAKMNCQRLGGGMRQAGIIAAPGIYALDYVIDRLKEDNQKAYQLAKKLSAVEGIHINLDNVQTNIIAVDITKEDMNADQFIELLKEKKLK